MTLPKEQIDAMRECLQILSPLHAPTMRQKMALNTDSFIQKGTWFDAFELEHIPLLFYPSDSVKATAMLEAMENAYKSGELQGGERFKRRFTPSQLAAWADCPPVPANSPLRFWLPAFMQADTQHPAPAQNAAKAAPVVQAKTKRRTWWDVASPYIVEVLRGGQYATAKDLHRALEVKAGEANSPFSKGTGEQRNSLFIRELAQPLSVKTVQNSWQKLRTAAARK